MKKLGLVSLAAAIALSSAAVASDVSISGDARVRGYSLQGLTSDKANEKYDSRIRFNLNAKNEAGVKVHARVRLENTQWATNDTTTDKFYWDEADVTVPLGAVTVKAGRMNVGYGTTFYHLNGDKADVLLVAYKLDDKSSVYVLNNHIIEGSENSDAGIFSTGEGDLDAYVIGGSTKIDALTVGGRYVSVQDQRKNATTGKYADTDGFFVDAYAKGMVAGLVVEGEFQQRGGDLYDKDMDKDQQGIYALAAMPMGDLVVGLAYASAKNGYKAGGDFAATYLTNANNGAHASLGRFGALGNTTAVIGVAKYAVSDKVGVEAAVAMIEVEKAAAGGGDLKVTEIDLGATYKLGADASYVVKYANGNFDDSKEDISNIIHSVEVKF